MYDLTLEYPYSTFIDSKYSLTDNYIFYGSSFKDYIFS